MSTTITENEKRFLEKAKNQDCLCDESGNLVAYKFSTEERRIASRLVSKGVLTLVPGAWNYFPATRVYRLNPDCQIQVEEKDDSEKNYRTNGGGIVTVNGNVLTHRMPW